MTKLTSDVCTSTSAGKLPSKSDLVAGCRCTLLAGNSSISLAGSEEQIYVSQQSPKMASESFFYALLLLLSLFLEIFPLGAPVL